MFKTFYKNRKDYINLLALVILSRIFLLAIVYTLRLFSTPTSYGFATFLGELSSRWDGNSYLFIAKNWYVNHGDEAGFIVFPPLFPIFIKAATDILANYKLSSLIVTNFFFFFTILLFYKINLLDNNKNTAKRIVLLYALFPTAYFLNVGYPESMFVFFLLAGFYFLRREKYLLAGVYAGFATLTRPFGVAIWPALFIEWLSTPKRKIKNLIPLILFGAISTAIYLWINFQTFGDYFAFSKMLSKFWQKDFEFFTTGIWQSWNRGIFSSNQDYYKYLVGYSEAISATLAWVLVSIMLIRYKSFRLSYAIYALIAIFMATSTNFILSIPRYYLSIPFLFLLPAKSITNRYILYLLYFSFVLCNIYLLFRFSRGQWAF